MADLTPAGPSSHTYPPPGKPAKTFASSSADTDRLSRAATASVRADGWRKPARARLR
jgi:hypothetical protein